MKKATKQALEQLAKQAAVDAIYNENPDITTAYDKVMSSDSEGWTIEGFVISNIHEHLDVETQKILLKDIFDEMFKLAVKANQA